MQSLISYTGCMLILMLSTIVSAQVQPEDYNVRQAVPFNGAMFTITNTSNGCTGSDGLLNCDNPNLAKLTDGNFSLSGEQFFAFSRSGSSSGRLLFSFANSVSSVVLSFYNSPNVSIGLPEISVLKGINQPVPYFFSDNDDLTQNDSQLRNVTLSLSQEIAIVQLDITFPNSSKIDWLLLNEIEFYDGTPLSPPMDPIIFKDGVSTVVTLGTDNIQSTVRLSCTVVNAGSFEWQWLYNNETLTDSSRYQVWIGDATRTSTLTISELAYSDQGIYTCRANRQGNVSIGSERLISLILQDGISQSTNTLSSITATIPVSIDTSSTSNPFTSTVSSPTGTVISPPTDAPDPASSSNTAVVVGISVTIIFVAVLVIVVIALIIIVVCCKRKQKPLTRSEPVRTSIKYNVAAKEAKYDEEPQETYSVVDKKPPPVPPQNFDDKDAKSEKPELARITKLTGFEMVENTIYGKTSTVTTDDTLYTYASVDQPPAAPPRIEAAYEYANPVDDREIYSEPKWTQGEAERHLDNLLYTEHEDQPFEFVESTDYVDGAIYAEPGKVMRHVNEVTHENLQEIVQLGTGQFGEVMLAATVGLSLKDLRLSSTDDDKTVSISVAVKKIRGDHDTHSLQQFQKEIKFMSQLDHEHVVRLLALSDSSCEEQFIVMEYMENGDLNQYLLNHHFTSDHPPSPNHLSPQILLSMSIQIASGMAYLASCNYIHRDLATRNCLVGANNVIKVGDFGLSRNLYDSVYYKVSGKAKMPIRWMSTECFYGKFSEKSDVWAYGITVWEIYTMGREPPFPQLHDSEIVEDALKGEYRTLSTRPTTCPVTVFAVLKKCCWNYEPQGRAHFSEIYQQLVGIQQLLYP